MARDLASVQQTVEILLSQERVTLSDLPYNDRRRLLVRREPTLLIETEGQSFVLPTVPKPLQKPLVTVMDVTNISFEISRESMPLLINQGDFSDENLYYWRETNSTLALTRDFAKLLGHNEEIVFSGLMSGRRSALYANSIASQGFFRMKGVSLRPAKPQSVVHEDGTFWIWGGEKYTNVLYERNMSQRFNLLLREEGITPVMVYAGMWKYPEKVKRYRSAASLWEVEGDTRLDEFRTAVELHLEQGLKEKGKASARTKKILNSFYSQCGYVVGQLLNLMHRSGQSWSCDSDRTNAHLGNVVLWRVSKDKAALGLVDFDASCDSNDFSKDKLRKVQEKDLTDFVGWLYRPEPMSLPLTYLSFEVENGGRQSDPWEHLKIFPQGMATLEKSLLRGYQNKSRRLSTEIDLGPLWQEVMKTRERKE